MKDFKNSTRTKYYTGEGDVYNERGAGAMTEGERRMLTDAVAKKPMPQKMPDSGAVTRLAGAAAGAAARAGARVGAKAMPRGTGAMTDLDMQRLKAERKAMPTGAGAMSDRETQMLKAAAAKKGVPAHSDKPIVRRNKGGLMAMPKGKCK